MDDYPRHLHVPLNEHSHQHLHDTYPQDHLHDRFHQDYLNAYDHSHPHHHPYHHPISTSNPNPHFKETHSSHKEHSSHYHPKDHHGEVSHRSDREIALENQMITENTDVAVKGFLDYVEKNSDASTLRHDYEKVALDPLDPRSTKLDSVSRSAMHHFSDGYNETEHYFGIIDRDGIDDFKQANPGL
eukprot:TRINITY_DN1876_c0_g1_i2.p1 TRINITY_DN1876_c0_g1~~TRINITY_DN1876_c0_g1_i2.p1  ORF type:complete len:186 (-),score=33.41 TRINITY_DN1876_c0_g1_i2:206-763(-)